VFKLDPATGAESGIHAFQGGTIDGALPLAGLVDMGAVLFGTHVFGGSRNGNSGCGTVFAIRS
jgi:hypothetical protein